MPDILLITPPFTQLNTPYPATAYLKGFLNTKGISAFQLDLGIEVTLKLFSADGLKQLFAEAERKNTVSSDNAIRIFSLRHTYCRIIDQVILFLQGNNQTLARLICSENYLPQANRFEQMDDLEWAFGNMGIQDKAKYLATLFLEDLADFIKECVDGNFGFSRYAERLGQSANSFDDLYHELTATDATYIDKVTLPILAKHMQAQRPELICFSVPFPGNLYSAFKCAQYIKAHFPACKTAMGGGFANTELRSLKDPRVFEFFDYITLDDGELPIEILHSNVIQVDTKHPDFNLFKRTFLLEKNVVVYNNYSLRKDYQQKDLGTPNYEDLLLDQYISVIEIANPMHSLWSDGRWNKLTMAHGCYWGKCTFCDISLDYIKNYEPVAASLLVDRMETIIVQTGERGFHFVDEAAPPALMRELALEILRRQLNVHWWTNIRFEKSFTNDLCRLLQAAGCIAVSGGLEVASNRLLELIQKGVTVEQVANVAQHFTENGIMVHAYLMYAFPTQTVQETVDSLEMVRQLFEQGVLQSGFWHQFALTAHSPVGMDPAAYGVIPKQQPISFANNDIDFEDSTGIDHNQFSFGLKKSLFNYLHGNCFDFPLQEWFDFAIPATTIDKDFIANSLSLKKVVAAKPSSKLVWLGVAPKSINHGTHIELEFHNTAAQANLVFEPAMGKWIIQLLHDIGATQPASKSYAEVQASYEKEFSDFTLCWFGEEMELLREMGLVVV